MVNPICAGQYYRRLAWARLLTETAERTFSKLVPFLILFATILFLAQGLFRRLVRAKRTPCSSAINLGGDLFQFAVAIYGGYFGAGIGILMLATFGFIGLANIREMNTLKTLLGSLD